MGNAMPLRRGALASFVGYAFSHTLGMPLLTGGAVRFRLYSAWGLPAGEIAGIIAFNSLTLWLGVAAMLAMGGIAAPDAIGNLLALPAAAVGGLAVGLGVLLLAYPCLSLVFRQPLRLREWSFAWPPPPLAAAQLVLAVVDWTLAALTLWLLLPPVGLGFFAFAGVYTAASIAGVVSHVPAGLGVFEAVLLLSLPEGAHAPGVAAALILYRLIYYVLPLLLAALVFAAHQGEVAGGALLGRRRPPAPRHAAGAAQPPGTLVFIGGVVLLISGATPTVPSRLEWLGPLAPLAVIELSHFFGSLAGLALLVLALGSAAAADAAYVGDRGRARRRHRVLAAQGARLGGGALSRARAGGARSRRAGPSTARAGYWRSASPPLGCSPFWLSCSAPPGWASSATGTSTTPTSSGGNSCWRATRPRFLRATIGVVVAMVLLGGLQLVRFATPEAAGARAHAGWRRRGGLGAGQRRDAVGQCLASVLGDKRFLFSESGRSFIMYAVQGRSWIAMGEPVGAADERLELLWRFRERCDRLGRPGGILRDRAELRCRT